MPRIYKDGVLYNTSPSTASQLPYDNSDSGLSATNVKSAIDELAGGVGIIDYDNLSDKPQVNGVTLAGDKDSQDLGVVWQGTQAQYDAITTKDANTVYFITDAPGTVLATVATTGSYNDLLNKPTIDTSLNTASSNAIANGPVASFAESISSTVSNKMDKANPSGTGKLSLNRASGSAEGVNSIALGTNCIASGESSYSEGNGCTASSYQSHAEGNATTASGNSAHSEGRSSISSGLFAHAEGDGTTASGTSSHSEGAGTSATYTYTHAEGHSTTASGDASHAEGYNNQATGATAHAENSTNIASGWQSHAEGYGNTAKFQCQHVFGMYAVTDPSPNVDSNGESGTVKGNYIEIVGKGTTTNSRSNARTLDWSGNEVLAGGLKINGNKDVAIQSDFTPTAGTLTNINSALTGGSYTLTRSGKICVISLYKGITGSIGGTAELATLPSGFIPYADTKLVAISTYNGSYNSYTAQANANGKLVVSTGSGSFTSAISIIGTYICQ